MIKVKKLVPCLTILFVYSFKVVFLYGQNANEISFSETLIPLCFALAIGYLIFALAFFAFKSAFVSALFSSLAGILFVNYALVEKLARRLTPILRPWHIVPLALAILLLALCFINRRAAGLLEGACCVLCIGFGSMVVINLATALPKEIGRLTAAGKADTLTQTVKIDKSAERPNVYYLIFDEYASFLQLEQYCGYKNEPLDTFLKDKGFTTSYDSFNDTIYTETVLSNIWQLDYIFTDDDSAANKRAALQNSPLHHLLSKGGYVQQGIGEVSWLGFESILKVQEHGALTMGGESFVSLLKRGTIFDNKLSLVTHEEESAQLVLQTLDALDNVNAAPNSSLFTLFYVNSPHEPFYFNKDGEMNTPDKMLYSGGNDSSAYLGQLQYITKRLSYALDRLIQNDPGCIILLSSDHGYRYEQNTPRKDCERILNAMYYKGEPMEELNGKSGVNTMRLLLNKLFGIALPYVELPNE